MSIPYFARIETQEQIRQMKVACGPNTETHTVRLYQLTRRNQFPKGAIVVFVHAECYPMMSYLKVRHAESRCSFPQHLTQSDCLEEMGETWHLPIIHSSRFLIRAGAPLGFKEISVADDENIWEVAERMI